MQCVAFRLKMVNNRPKRLLIRFTAQEAANIIFANAKRLRQVDDEQVRTYVYVKRDLFPEEAKMKYEIRQKIRRKHR